MLDLEHIDGDMMKRWRVPGERVGDVYKADGNGGPNNIEGPWSAANGYTIPVNPDCPMWSIDDRYTYTYQRMNNSWGSPAAIRQMIETVNTLRNAAVASGDYTALRNYFMTNWDVDRLRDAIAIRNWAEVWDDSVHNHFFYQRPGDGKWLLIPQDKDREFGEAYGWTTGRTFYSGEVGQGGTHLIKDAYLKAFRTEYWNRMIELVTKGVLSPAVYRPKVDLAASTYSFTDFMASPASQICNPATELALLKNFADNRQADVLDTVAAAACTPTTCGLKGEYYQTLTGDTTHDFTKASLKLTRTDASVNFDWTTNAPAAGLPVDGFQVRWTGKVVPRFSEQYTFYVQADDGVRLWINGTQIINRWTDNASVVESSGTITLTAGTPVSITLEYYDGTGSASAKLAWSSATQWKQYIPTSRFSPM